MGKEQVRPIGSQLSVTFLKKEEMKKYVDEKKEQKSQALLQSDVTNISDDKDEDMEEGEATK
ncbi:hypothetical protein H5410_002024 [Solanum commersonii]|uniref:Uncharacterized protein n=1 Tax=Solanum commersonii TaxID=4109 RepID=A0A9J6B175_SOLCO|nr:hypothetical protein H5410_002024 [Solanum commersonii]